MLFFQAENKTDWWAESYLSSAILQIEKLYKDEILQEWTIVDLVIKDEKLLIKWSPRLTKLSPIEVQEKYRRII